MEGGAVLTGRNGRGKTTLLQLVPIFYGENPARIVGTETNRLDFNAYYLPRLTSYICFEYLRRDVPCMVILHASQQGGERRYRFVRSPYRADLFLLPDGINILQAPDLRRHFKLKGVIHSDSISGVSEYRSIIQGKGAAGRRGSASAPWSRTTPSSAAAIISPISRRSSAVCSCAARTSRTSSGWWCPASRTPTRRSPSPPKGARSPPGRSITAPTPGPWTRPGAWPRCWTARPAWRGRGGAWRHPRPGAAPARASGGSRRRRTAGAGAAGDSWPKRRSRPIAGLPRASASAWRGQAARRKSRRPGPPTWSASTPTGCDATSPPRPTCCCASPSCAINSSQLHRRREALLGEQEQISLKYERLLNDLDRRHTRAKTAAAEARTDLFQGFEPRSRPSTPMPALDLEGCASRTRSERQVLDARLQETLGRKGEWSQRARAPQPDPGADRDPRCQAAAVEALDA
jgi:hypothetical protein